MFPEKAIKFLMCRLPKVAPIREKWKGALLPNKNAK
jgi:hypothetical protein